MRLYHDSLEKYVVSEILMKMNFDWGEGRGRRGCFWTALTRKSRLLDDPDREMNHFGSDGNSFDLFLDRRHLSCWVSSRSVLPEK
jgi:hypothetical protein